MKRIGTGRAEITNQTEVSSILASIEDELIGMEYAALLGLKKEQREESPDEMRREMERILLYSRLHYFGTYYWECYDGKEYMSRYEREMTEKILSERLKPENAAYDYPDFKKLYSGKMKEPPKAVDNWTEYINFNLNIDWRVAQELITEIPAMAATGVIGRDEIVAVYKEMLRGAGSRATKRAEALIDELCASIPLATRKGNTDFSLFDS